MWRWLKQLITKPNKRPTYRPRHSHQASGKAPVNRSKVTASEPVTPQLEQPQAVQPVARVNEQPLPTKPNAMMVILYLDQNQSTLREPQVIMGQLGDVINFDVQPTTSYTLSAISGYTQHFPAEYAIMTLQFERQFGQPVIYYQIDYDTNEILAYPTIISGRIGESFEMVPPVAKGYNLIRVQGSSRGRFTDKVHPIFAFYRKEAWQTVKNVNFYIELKRALQPFDEPDGQKQAINLPAKSVWRVFQQITKVDGTIWYNIGGAEWLTAKYTASHTHPMKPELTYAGMRFHSNPLALTGQIDFVAGRSVTTYDQPYGASIGKLADGEKVNITHILRDDQGLHWYQLDTGAVLLATYIKVN